MPRRPAAERHRDTAPAAVADPAEELARLLVAFHHPVRRWLCELLGVHGPANVGQLAARTGLAVGSVSHHLKALHRHGLVEPAPELARDTRESWWRLVPRRLEWTVDDFEDGSLGQRVAQAAEAENLRHQVRAMRAHLAASPTEPVEWRRASSASDTFVSATVEQLADLSSRIDALVRDWSQECAADAEQHPDAVRRPVRAIARAFPSGPVRP